MPYKKTAQSTETIFEVTPEAPPPAPALARIGPKILKGTFAFFAFWIGWGYVMALFRGVIGVLLGLAWTAVLIWWVKKKPRTSEAAMKDRSPSRFSVNPEGISLNGQFLKSGEIHRILIRNEILERLNNQGTVVAIDGSAASRNYAVGRSIGLEWMRQLGAVSYRVEVESGGVPRVLAGGLTEAAAFAVSSDVSGIAGIRAA